MTRRRRILAAVLAVAALAAGGALIVPGIREFLVRLVEPRDPAVAALRDETELKAAFNAHPERIRVVAWLSPT